MQLLFLLLLVVVDMASAIFINVFKNGEKFESAKLKKGLIEKGIELLIIETVQLAKMAGYGEAVATTGAEALTMGIFVLQEITSIYENYKKLQ